MLTAHTNVITWASPDSPELATHCSNVTRRWIIPPRLRHGARIIRSKQVSGPALNSPSHTELGSGLSSCKTQQWGGPGIQWGLLSMSMITSGHRWPWGDGGKEKFHDTCDYCCQCCSTMNTCQHVLPQCQGAMRSRELFNALTGYWIDGFYWILTWEMKWSG